MYYHLYSYSALKKSYEFTWLGTSVSKADNSDQHPAKILSPEDTWQGYGTRLRVRPSSHVTGPSEHVREVEKKELVQEILV